MKYIILIIFLFTAINCGTTRTQYIETPISKPPKMFMIETNIQSNKDLLYGYREAIIKITEWQSWYNIQVKSNYFTIKE